MFDSTLKAQLLADAVCAGRCAELSAEEPTGGIALDSPTVAVGDAPVADVALTSLELLLLLLPLLAAEEASSCLKLDR